MVDIASNIILQVTVSQGYLHSQKFSQNDQKLLSLL
jgi:hypothetical protein